MQAFNNSSTYGVVSILLHWAMAILIIGMYFLGEYMVDLEYYDKWYHLAPWWHKSIGISVLGLLIVRLVTRLSSPGVRPLPGYKKWEIIVSRLTHVFFYIVVFCICSSGFMVATSKGAPLEVFSWFDIPAITTLTESQTDFFAEVHEITINILVVLLFLHISGAFKHHFINRDSTLTRMLGR